MIGIGAGIGISARPYVGGGGGNGLLLDTYKNASAAYSIRKLRTAYTGNCIKVRRSSDNTEQDIGFVANELDTTSLTSFVGSGNGFITKWYDQSGNGYDVSQATAASQPRIVLSGVLDVASNGKPALTFSGQWLGAGDVLNINNGSMTSFVVSQSNNGDGTFFGKSITGPGTNRYSFSNQFWLLVDSSGNLYYDSYTNAIQYVSKLYNFNIKRLSKIQAYRNDTTLMLEKSITADIGSNTNLSFNIGTYGTVNQGSGLQWQLAGNMQELIIYLSDNTANQSLINANINTYYTIY